MKLECFLLVRLHDKSAIFYSAENAQRMNLDHVDFVLGRDILCEFDYCPLAVRMPPTMVCQAPPRQGSDYEVRGHVNVPVA